MTFEDVKKLLEKIGVPKSSYNIDCERSAITPGTIIMERTPNAFFVYWTERNELYDERLIENENEAVEYFLALLKDSSKTYRKYVTTHNIA